MEKNEQLSPEIAWQPDEDRIQSANLTRFMCQHALPDYAALMHRSTSDPAWFTDALLQFLDIRFTQPYSTVLDVSDGVQFPHWCVGGRMNIIANCLDKAAGTPLEHQPALIYESETDQVQIYNYAQLRESVNRAASGLRMLGIHKGDVVALYMPMTPEIVIALLAIAKIGAIILPLFSGFGAGALVTRLVDTGAKALITCDTTLRRGKSIDMKAVADEAALQTPTLQHIIVVRNSTQPARCSPIVISNGPA